MNLTSKCREFIISEAYRSGVTQSMEESDLATFIRTILTEAFAETRVEKQPTNYPTWNQAVAAQAAKVERYMEGVK